MLRDALTYPIRKNGWMMILLGALFSVVLDFFSAVPLFGWPVSIFAGGYFGAFYLSIVGTTMGGAAELPDWPSFRDFIDDILMPFLTLMWINVLSFAPAVAVFLLIKEESPWYVPSLLAALAYAGIYFSMAVLASLAFGNVVAALPHVVFPAIVKTFPLYLGTLGICLVGFLLVVLEEKLVADLPYLGVFLVAGVALYFMMFQGRLIGNFYQRKMETIGWE